MKENSALQYVKMPEPSGVCANQNMNKGGSLSRSLTYEAMLRYPR